MSQETNIDFMKVRKPFLAGSLLLVVLSIASLFYQQLNLGLDFTGGTLIDVRYPEAADLNEIRQTLAKAGFDDVVVQNFGTDRDVVVRFAPPKEEVDNKPGEAGGESKGPADAENPVWLALKAAEPGLEKRRIDMVGPQVGNELRDQSGVAMLVALGFMLLYVTIRFTNKFAMGAVAALFHDVIIILGLFSITGMQFDLTVLAAVLAVIGYSLNDSIVVADRIRENFKATRNLPPEEVINQSINQTLSRTVRTSVTTMLVLVALFFLGGELIHNFSVALIAGVIVGTYSSIFIASNVLLAMNIDKEDFLVKETDESLDELP